MARPFVTHVPLSPKNYIGVQGVFARESGNTTEHMLKNGHGDVTNIIKTGEVTNWLDYDPYGNQTMGNTTNPFRYSGEYFDEESGLIYLRNRYYNPQIGRFITEDPHWNVDNMIYGDNPVEDSPAPDISAIMQSNNLYAYCMNNPVNNIDVSGEMSVSARMLWDAFNSDGAIQDYSHVQEIVRTFYFSPILNEKIDGHLAEFKETGLSSKTYNGTISFYGNDTNSNDFDLHYAVGLASYSMTFTKHTEERKVLGFTFKETVYSVKITITDEYDFDEYREGFSVSNLLNNWGYDMQKDGNITPYKWIITFTKKGV